MIPAARSASRLLSSQTAAQGRMPLTAWLTATQTRPCSCWSVDINSTAAASLPGGARHRTKRAPFASSSDDGPRVPRSF